MTEEFHELPEVNETPPMTTMPESSHKSSIGCWLGALITMFVVTVLVIVGLFLPPFSIYDRLFGEQFTMLQAGEGLPVDGLLVAIQEDSPSGDFGVRISSVSLLEFENNRGAEWVTLAKNTVPPYLALQSRVYDIATTGTPPPQVALTVDIPEGAPANDVLDLYGWYEESERWEFLPSAIEGNKIIARVENVPQQLAIFQATPLDPIIIAAINITQMLTPEIGQLATIVAPAGLQPTLAGTLTGSLAPGFEANQGYKIMPVIRNFSDPRALDTETITTILNNTSTRNTLVRNIAAAAQNFDGVIIDFRGLPDEVSENFTTFIADLSEHLHQAGLRLGVVVPAAAPRDGIWYTGAYNWRELGNHVDYLQIIMGLNPLLFEPGADRPVEAMLRWAVREVNRYQLVLDISAQSIREAGGSFATIGYDAALAALGNVKTEATTSESGTIEPGAPIRVYLDGMDAISGVNTLIQAPYVEYVNEAGELAARVWLTTGDALRYRMDWTVPFALAGVAFDDLLEDDLAVDVLDAIREYKTQIPNAPGTADLALRWRIESADGLLDEIITGLNEELVVTIAAPDNNYAINVEVIGVEDSSPRSGVAVAVFQPTPTPTPLPTATPTPTPTITPSPAPIVATNPPPQGAPVGPVGVPAAAPGAGSIAAGFEYGGHVTSTSSTRAINAMRSAGMTWMKVQIRYSPGASPGITAEAINNAHANGFKILLGIVGWPNDLEAGGQGYVQGFAEFLGGVAGMGPDAIEVWNEPNLSREWPEGQISAAAYTEMLRLAYERIKAINPSVMVISAAPAPTGAEAAFPGKVVNDDRYVREMVQAGALNYMDCLGAHYNEGLVAPSRFEGDPRDNYYTRYFWGMVNTYWNATGGQRPICFTELGYLSAEGYGSLPAGFTWAQGFTVSQQAAYLAEAAALSSQSGKVRLMIIWNVDFTNWGADPMAGYAIIRADGSCPACSALAGAR